MKVLLDECIPRKFKNCLPGHECQTVPIAGFAGKKNGELLRLAEAEGFDVFLLWTAASHTNRISKADALES